MGDGYEVHGTSIVGERARIGRGTVIWQFCNIMDGASIGDACMIGQGVFVEGGVRIGDRVKVKNNVALYDGIVCEDDVFLGPGCVFTNVMAPRSFIEKKDEFRTTLIMEGATIGANATILCGHTIGPYALVGAGSVVTRDVPGHALVTGNPARLRGYVCRCGERLQGDGSMGYRCSRCHEGYALRDGRIVLGG